MEEAGEGCRRQVGALGVCRWSPYSALWPLTGAVGPASGPVPDLPGHILRGSRWALLYKVGPSPLWTRPRDAPSAWGWEGAAAQEEPVFRGLLGQIALAPPTQPAALVSLVLA